MLTEIMKYIRYKMCDLQTQPIAHNVAKYKLIQHTEPRFCQFDTFLNCFKIMAGCMIFDPQLKPNLWEHIGHPMDCFAFKIVAAIITNNSIFLPLLLYNFVSFPLFLSQTTKVWDQN